MTSPSDSSVPLPPLPPCDIKVTAFGEVEPTNRRPFVMGDFFTADQMREYALAARRAALPVAPSNERIDAGWGKLSEPKIRTLMQIAHKWAGPDEDDCRSDDLEMALREVRVPTQTRPAAPVAALSDADRELMEQTKEALITARNNIYPQRPQGSADPQAADYDHDVFMWDYYEKHIAALRTRLLRHSEGKE